MSLFTRYEERPPFCQGVPVWFDTVDGIADYYSQGGYETTLKRSRDGITLRIFHADTEQRPGCDLTMELPFELQYNARSTFHRQVLVYGHPPTLEDYDEFQARWREVKELL
jgi:hypothetical protein